MVLTVVAALMLSGGQSCGVERNDVKDLKDPASVNLGYASFSGASINALRELPAPTWTPHLPRQPGERIIYQVKAVLLAAKLEADQDIHLVIADPTKHAETMIAEIPAAVCLGGAPPAQAARIVASRKTVLAKWRLGAKLKTLSTPVSVTITGLGHFDKLHGQDGVAPNGIELHPVLDIVFSNAIPAL